MRFSICIPHYNRWRHLKEVLASIVRQRFSDYEVVISDDMSTDESATAIPQYIDSLEPHVASRFRYCVQSRNLGYDGNVRASLNAGTGTYLLLLGNDDALSDETALVRLDSALRTLAEPDVALTNVCDYADASAISCRATETAIAGSGASVALRWFRSFSFVAGVVFSRRAFIGADTDVFDGSIYIQIYLATRIIAAGGTLGAINEVVVAKDVAIAGARANSWRDTLAAQNKSISPMSGGLDQVARVTCEAILPYVPRNQHERTTLAIFRQLLLNTYPYWLCQYRKQGVYKAAVNIALGCLPRRMLRGRYLSLVGAAQLHAAYWSATAVGLLTPLPALESLEKAVRNARRSRRVCG